MLNQDNCEGAAHAKRRSRGGKKRGTAHTDPRRRGVETRVRENANGYTCNCLLYTSPSPRD
eukprot:5537046-Alexandrium_andersonii.AAC.1